MNTVLVRVPIEDVRPGDRMAQAGTLPHRLPCRGESCLLHHEAPASP